MQSVNIIHQRKNSSQDKVQFLHLYNIAYEYCLILNKATKQKRGNLSYQEFAEARESWGCILQTKMEYYVEEYQGFPVDLQKPVHDQNLLI